jgi:hypothetical protein
MLAWVFPAPFFCVCAGYEMKGSTRLLRLFAVFVRILWVGVRRLSGLADVSSRKQITGRIDRTGEPQLDWYR